MKGWSRKTLSGLGFAPDGFSGSRRAADRVVKVDDRRGGGVRLDREHRCGGVRSGGRSGADPEHAGRIGPVRAGPGSRSPGLTPGPIPVRPGPSEAGEDVRGRRQLKTPMAVSCPFVDIREPLWPIYPLWPMLPLAKLVIFAPAFGSPHSLDMT